MNAAIDGFRLREATSADSPRVRALVFSVLAEYHLPTDAHTDGDLDDIQSAYAGGAFVVVEDQAGRLVGTVGLCRIDDETCELRKMYLLPAARGRGIGKLLLEQMIQRARQLGIRRMTLETAGVLETAIALYRRYGFRLYQPEHCSPRCDQAYILDLTQGYPPRRHGEHGGVETIS